LTIDDFNCFVHIIWHCDVVSMNKNKITMGRNLVQTKLPIMYYCYYIVVMCFVGVVKNNNACNFQWTIELPAEGSWVYGIWSFNQQGIRQQWSNWTSWGKRVGLCTVELLIISYNSFQVDVHTARYGSDLYFVYLILLSKSRLEHII